MISIDVTIKTKSNLYIGGMPQGFEIGGIDMVTVNRDGKPYIPASSFKGALREICKDNSDDKIAGIFKDYQPARSPELGGKHLYIFGIEGYNRSPKLIFTDFEMEKNANGPYFSIDIKNSIEETNNGTKLLSNPRTYKAACAGLSFKGTIYFNFKDKKTQVLVREYIVKMTKEFSEGIYRIGNSKSRGYGWISVEIK